MFSNISALIEGGDARPLETTLVHHRQADGKKDFAKPNVDRLGDIFSGFLLRVSRLCDLNLRD